MMLSHVFALFSIGAILFAELVRTIRRREIDWILWAMLLFPLALGLTYVPLMQRYDGGVFPQRFQGGPRKVAVFFAKLALAIATPFALGALATGIADWRLRKVDSPSYDSARLEDYGLIVGMLMPVFLINAMLMRTHGAFFERYCLTGALAFCVAAVLILGKMSEFRHVPGIAALAVFLCAGLANSLIRPAVNYFSRGERASFGALRPELPVVAASGLAFLEMDHYEDPALVKRLFYLTDREAAVTYAHATIFEGMPMEKHYFPIRANVEPYTKFISTNRHFLVFGTMDFAEDWLLRKLMHDGAEVKHLARVENVSYNDHDVYEVTIH